MIYSMTGFGAADYKDDNITIKIEVKTLNSKHSDVKFKLSHNLQEKEMLLRNLVHDELKRGKIDVTIDIDLVGVDDSYQLNTELLESYFEKLKQIQDRNSGFQGDFVQAVLRIPSVIEEREIVLEENHFPLLEKTLQNALDRLMEFRKTEGASIDKDFRLRVERILELLKRIEPLEEIRKDQLRERFTEALKDFGQKMQVDKNRFEQELLYYLEKLDITEEKVRLQQHCLYFLELLEEKKMEKGKKLNFMIQELGREINTLGSKANFSEIQKIVVDMKNELEKIKEQIANVV